MLTTIDDTAEDQDPSTVGPAAPQHMRILVGGEDDWVFPGGWNQPEKFAVGWAGTETHGPSLPLSRRSVSLRRRPMNSSRPKNEMKYITRPMSRRSSLLAASIDDSAEDEGGRKRVYSTSRHGRTQGALLLGSLLHEYDKSAMRLCYSSITLCSRRLLHKRVLTARQLPRTFVQYKLRYVTILRITINSFCVPSKTRNRFFAFASPMNLSLLKTSLYTVLRMLSVQCNVLWPSSASQSLAIW